MTPIIIASIVFVTYVLYIYFKYGVLPSISHSSYVHKKPMLFFSFMSALGISLAVFGYIQDDKWYNFLPTIAGVLFVICGCSPFFYRKTFSGDSNAFESKLHAIGATGGIVVMLAYLLIAYCSIWPIVAVGIPTYIMMKKNVKNHTWWIEIIAFTAISIRLFMA